MKTSRIPALIYAVFLGLIWLWATDSLASPVYSRRTSKDCAYCHPPTNYNLTDAGKYYQEHKTLKGYRPNEDEKKDAPRKSGTHSTEPTQSLPGKPPQQTGSTR